MAARGMVLPKHGRPAGKDESTCRSTRARVTDRFFVLQESPRPGGIDDHFVDTHRRWIRYEFRTQIAGDLKTKTISCSLLQSLRRYGPFKHDDVEQRV